MKKIGIIGFGNMGSAMAERMAKISYGFRKIGVLVFDKDTQKAEAAKGIEVAKGINDLVERADTVILAVKPQDIDSVLMEIKNGERPALIISVAAGITTAHIETILGHGEVIRGMPNLPAKIGKGMTGLCKSKFASEGNLDWSKDLFYSLGQVVIVKEEMMDAITAVSGSGPAYVCYFLQKESFDPRRISWRAKRQFLREFLNAAERLNFNRGDAALLVNMTFSGTIDFLKKTKTHPADLIKQVASKGGTTEAGLEVLQKGGTLNEAVQAAKNRAEELSKKE